MNPVRWYHRPEIEPIMILLCLALLAWLWHDRI